MPRLVLKFGSVCLSDNLYSVDLLEINAFVERVVDVKIADNPIPLVILSNAL